MKKLSLYQSGVNAVEIITYIDFLICKEELDYGVSFSKEEYDERFQYYLKRLNTKEF